MTSSLTVSQEKDCASLYEVKTYVEPNEIEPSLVCIHHYSVCFGCLLYCAVSFDKYIHDCVFVSFSLRVQLGLYMATRLQGRMSSASVKEL